MKRLYLFAVPLFAFVLLAAFRADASSYFRDGFNYTTGTVLGVNSPWTNSQTSITIGSGSLTYSNLTPVSPGANCILLVSNSSSVYTYAPLNTDATSGNVYVSFLIKYTNFTGSFTRGGLLQTGNTPTTLVTTNDPLDFVDNTVTGGFKLGIRAKDGTSYYVTNAYSPLQVGTTYLVVMRYKFADGTASMWVNPPIGGAEPASADATSLPNGGIVSDLRYIYFRAGSAAPGYLVDNVQVGSTWQDVTSAASKLVVTLPGQTFVSGLGNSGTVLTQTSGVPFNITLSATASDGVTLASNYSGIRAISYSGPGESPIYTTNATFTNGQATSLSTTLNAGQTTAISATDGLLTGVASSPVTVKTAFYAFQDSYPGFFSGLNMWFTNISGLTLYTWSSTGYGLSVTNWYLEGQLQEQPLAPALPGMSRYSINVNPSYSPTYYIASDTVLGPYASPQPITEVTTPDFANFTLVISNAAITTAGVPALPAPAQPTLAGVKSAGGYQISFSGPAGQNFSVHASTNLSAWSNISTGVITTSPMTFTDSASTNLPRRFYRVSLP